MRDHPHHSLADFYASKPIRRKRGPVAMLLLLIFLYRRRLRLQPLPELLAILGIAAGVALLFAVQIANQSVTSSFGELVRGIGGKASFQVAARSPEGMDQQFFHKVARLPDVALAAPLIERRIVVVGPNGRRPLTLIGVDERLRRFNGQLVRRFTAHIKGTQLGVYLPSFTAEAIGVGVLQDFKIQAGERTLRQPAIGILTSKELGSFAQSPIAITNLGVAQEIAAMPGRLSRILVAPRRGHSSAARAALIKLAAGKLNVRSTDSEIDLLKQAAKPDAQSSTLFSAISLIVGFLLAFNAMLLTVAKRRRMIASLSLIGTRRSTILASLIFDALVLAFVGSILGIVFGDLLSIYAFNQVPYFLTEAFTVGSQRTVSFETIIFSIAGGFIATLAATLSPALQLYITRPVEATMAPSVALHQRLGSSRATTASFVVGAVLALFATTTAILDPKLAITSVGILVVGVALMQPAAVGGLVRLVRALARARGGALSNIAVGELGISLTRTTALATIGMLAVFGILSLRGAEQDLRRGINQLSLDTHGRSDLWVSPSLKENSFSVENFSAQDAVKRIKKLPEVASVSIQRSAFLDFGNRRLLVVAYPFDELPFPSSQLVNGSYRTARKRFRERRWAALAAPVAKAHHLQIGQQFYLPTPSGNQPYRLAATTSNHGWSAGAVAISSHDFASDWMSSKASALKVRFKLGTPITEGQQAVQAAIGRDSPLRAQTKKEIVQEIGATTAQGMARLNQISTIVLVAAVISIVAAMLSVIMQRRSRLASLAAMGMYRSEIYKALFIEVSVVVSLGCFLGLVFGFLGQALSTRYLEASTGFPAAFSPAIQLGIETAAAITALSVIAMMLPAHFAARISPRAIFADE